MLGHDMGPSCFDGFNSQCRNCGALDTEIRFTKAECPKAFIKPVSPVSSGSVEPLELREPTYQEKVSLIQAKWMDGYCFRQFCKIAGNF
jgi:hypothetical protein